jgi:ferredoxin-NADP reductase
MPLTPSSISFGLGALLVVGVSIQLALMLVHNLRQNLHVSPARAREIERLELEIRLARLRVESVEQERAGWNGVRKFTVARKVAECEDTFSFYLEPHDRRPIPGFKPGQYLTFQLSIPGVSKSLVRCYSLSDCARSSHYRVTIKRCPPPPGTDHPPGVVSSFFSDFVREGDILDVKAPSGHFYLDLEKEKPVVLISGGVGITPMIAMANALIQCGSSREVWFFFGCRSSRDHMLRAETLALGNGYSNFNLRICYSRPDAGDVKGRDYHHEGRVTGELIRGLLPSQNYQFYLCGPSSFMESITDALADWGIPDSAVHFEAFGPASIKRKAIVAVKQQKPADSFAVTFSKSGLSVLWSGGFDSLLDAADSCGIRIDAGCRSGNCGSCLVAVKAGEVEYLRAPGIDPEVGSCLACICKPKGELLIEA